jgi:hypothetical protein
MLQDFHTMAFDGTATGSMGGGPTALATVQHRHAKHGDKRCGVAGCQAGI